MVCLSNLYSVLSVLGFFCCCCCCCNPISPLRSLKSNLILLFELKTYTDVSGDDDSYSNPNQHVFRKYEQTIIWNCKPEYVPPLLGGTLVFSILHRRGLDPAAVITQRLHRNIMCVFLGWFLRVEFGSHTSLVRALHRRGRRMDIFNHY